MGNSKTLTPTTFWTRVDKTGDCWIWLGCKISSGYGQLRVDGIKYGAHVYAYIITYGLPPYKKQVNHKCGNKLCVRPEHLYVGSQLDNVIDSTKAGNMSNTKFTNEEITEMRKMFAEDANKTGARARIMEKFGVSSGYLSQILNQKGRAHV